jgi:hypothetical protein
MTPLRLVLEIYDRLIHPKSDADRDISDGEVETMLKAYGLLREFTTWMVHAYAPAPTGRLDISAWLQGIGFPTNPAEGQCGMRPGEWQDG